MHGNPLTKAIESIPDSLQLFNLPRLEKAFEYSFTTTFAPIPSGASDVIEFYIPESDFYIDPSETYLYFKAQIEQIKTPGSDGKPSTDAKAAPCNGFFHLLFDRIDIQISGTPMINSFCDSGFKAFFYTLFNYSACVKKTILRSILWNEDTYRHIDKRDLPSANNLGLNARYDLMKDGALCEMEGRPMHNFFLLKQFLPPRLPIRMKFFRKQPAEFCLVSPSDGATFKINLTDVKLHVRMVKPTPRIDAALEKKLSTQPALYCLYNAPDISSRQLSSGLQSFFFENLFSSKRLPSRVLFALTTHQNYLGTVKDTPLHFPHHNLQEIRLTIDNNTRSYVMDWTKNHYLPLYLALATELGNKDFECSSNITYADIPQLALYPFDLTESHSTDELHVPSYKNVRLELKFSSTLTEPLQLLIFTEQPDMFSIDKQRNFINTVEVFK